MIFNFDGFDSPTISNNCIQMENDFKCNYFFDPIDALKKYENKCIFINENVNIIKDYIKPQTITIPLEEYNNLKRIENLYIK